MAKDTQTNKAMVISTSRRYVQLMDDNAEILRGVAASKALEVTVGDYVLYEKETNKVVVTELLPRKNFLNRSIAKQSKRIAANLDKLFIVTATLPLFNTIFIDRILAAAYTQKIPCTLVLNKIDLDLEHTLPMVEIYKKIGIETIFTRARNGLDINSLIDQLANPNSNIVAFSGISGVGKSTLLNQLIPGLEIKTSAVSEKTGQGRQTTSQSYAYQYQRQSLPSLFIIDLPGVQNFGITHLSKEEVKAAFIEFEEPSRHCEFADCFHLAEPKCGVKDALEEDRIAISRYESYLSMLEELENAKEY